MTPTHTLTLDTAALPATSPTPATSTAVRRPENSGQSI